MVAASTTVGLLTSPSSAAADSFPAGVGASIPFEAADAPAAPASVPAPAAAAAPAAAEKLWGPGYWLAGRDGGVFAYGHASYYGSMGGAHLNAPVIDLAATAEGTGYWLVGSDGGIFSYGDAQFYGSTGGMRLNAHVVGMAPTPDGLGYWLVASDGGVFTFGDAQFYGSTGGMHLNAPAVSLTRSASGHGYWITTADGGVFAFGDAQYFGSMGGTHLNGKAVGLSRTASGNGYWIATADGGVFAFGDAPWMGSLGGGRLNSGIVAVTRSATGAGYRLVAGDGGVFTYGDAGFFGSAGGRQLNAPITAASETLAPARPPAPSTLNGQTGYDISWPQCGLASPGQPYSVAVVGVTGGRPFTSNPCLDSQWQWAGAGGSGAAVYMNTSNPSPAGAYAWGVSSAQDALARAASAGVRSPMWWLDVEFGNAWSSDRNANAQAVQGAIDALRGSGVQVGVYSTSYQWGVIVGGYAPGVPIWVAGAPWGAAASWCSGHGFGGGPTWMVQSVVGAFDNDYVCGPAIASQGQAFSLPLALPAPVQAAGPRATA